MERKKLDNAEIEHAIAELHEWKADGDKLKTSRKFDNFADALVFVNAVGRLAETADHHPDITFGWGYVDLELTTHDRGGITDVDFALAKQIDQIAG